MNFFNIFGKNKVVVIVQCRLSSTRLPGKALFPLADKTVLEWVLASMKKIKADSYYLATDVDSAPKLETIAKKSGYSFFAGDRDDVLKRFCDVINISKADTVVRATADNPFLFYEAASDLLDEFKTRTKENAVDYITWTGLPHGSGIEIFNAHSLLKAAGETDSPYDHEHVGPALYNHKENYKCLFIPAPEKFNHPDLRTTIDVYGDYRRARMVVANVLGKEGHKVPFTTEQIVNAVSSKGIQNPILFVPSLSKGHGTGHLRRCLDLAIKTAGDIYIEESCSLEETSALVLDAKQRGLFDCQIVTTLDHADIYKLAVTDTFVTEEKLYKNLSSKCPVLSIDEGSSMTHYADYLLDIIPSLGYNREANFENPKFITLPSNKRTKANSSDKIKNVLVVLGGEDPSGLTLPASKVLSELGLSVTAIISNTEKLEQLKKDGNFAGIDFQGPIEGLREKLYLYDLVVTHYGFTAYEAQAANCGVILLGTTPLHVDLARKYGFACVTDITKDSFKYFLDSPATLYNSSLDNDGLDENLGEFISSLSRGTSLCCPICTTKNLEKDTVVARIKQRTFRRCNRCGMLYMSWTVEEKQTEYNRAYFYEDYQKQYGKTYEDDFESIKAQGVRRINLVDYVHRRKRSAITPAVLDIGCALGPFMDAANDAGWQVYGIDVSQDAVNHVVNKLHYKASCVAFPDFDAEKEFGVKKFDAVTMWYVIEHFQNLDNVLKAVSSLVKKGGVFAFSTPSASGVSAKYNTKSFFEKSPSDHYTLWEPARAASILKKYGFSVVRVVSTGIHPERFPVSKQKFGKNTLVMLSKMFKMGDTFEIYCKKDN